MPREADPHRNPFGGPLPRPPVRPPGTNNDPRQGFGGGPPNGFPAGMPQPGGPQGLPGRPGQPPPPDLRQAAGRRSSGRDDDPRRRESTGRDEESRQAKQRGFLGREAEQRRGGRKRGPRRPSAPPPETEQDNWGQAPGQGPEQGGWGQDADQGRGRRPSRRDRNTGPEAWEQTPGHAPEYGQQGGGQGGWERTPGLGAEQEGWDQAGGEPYEDDRDEPPRRSLRAARVTRAGQAGRARLKAMPPVAYFVTAGSVVLVAVVVAVAVFAFSGGGGNKGVGFDDNVKVPGEGPLASAYSKASSTAAFEKIAARTDDPKPLSSSALFGTKTITDADSKATLKLTGSKLTSHCLSAIWGPLLARRLQGSGCTQAARAVYSDKKFAAMVTVFNLVDVKAANAVVADADPKVGNGFPLVLRGSTQMGRSYSTARGVAMGHYAVISWVQRIDGSGDEQDTDLLSLLVATGRPKAVLLRAIGHSSGK